MSPLSAVTFLPRAEPLSPVAVAALGPGVRALAERLLRLSDEELSRLTGVAGPDVAVVLGPGDTLPWFDGALFLGATGGLLWPTWAEPSVQPPLLERALRRELPASGPLALILPSLGSQATPRVVSLGAALPLSRARLLALAESP